MSIDADEGVTIRWTPAGESGWPDGNDVNSAIIVRHKDEDISVWVWDGFSEDWNSHNDEGLSGPESYIRFQSFPEWAEEWTYASYEFMGMKPSEIQDELRPTGFDTHEVYETVMRDGVRVTYRQRLSAAGIPVNEPDISYYDGRSQKTDEPKTLGRKVLGQLARIIGR